MIKRFLKRPRLMFVSPWLLAAAIGLLTLIILIFAVNNIQRERTMMTGILLQKGQSLIRFVEAGSRASFLTGRRGMMGLLSPEESEAQTQHLIEQVIENPDIHYISVINENGLIVAHSDPSLIGSHIERETGFLERIVTESSKNRGKYHIVKQESYPAKVFELVSIFQPFNRNSALLRKWRQRRLPKNHPETPGSRLLRSNPSFSSGLLFEEGKQYILVGLDMTELENTIKQYRYQISVLSLVLLLVGLGGWISLLAAQGFRISQDSLKRIQAFTGLLISKLPVGIIATDSEGRINTCNQSAAHFIGKDLERIMNRFPADSLPHDISQYFDGPDVNNNSIEMTENDLAFTSETGVSYSLHLSSVPVFNEEKVFNGRVLLMYDLSELKKLEKEVRRHDRLVALGKMAAGVAHEVRNPLSSIKGFATLLGAKFSAGSEEQESAQLLVQEAERLNRSITELLNYARPTPLKLEKRDIAEIIMNSLKLISTDAAALDIDISHEINTSLPLISVDADRLSQVLLNLFLNALQAVETDGADGGKLFVKTELSESRDTFNIIVRDNGSGIPEDLLDSIMDPYFTTKPDGTGLGLAMAYKIIDEHGGDMKFDSKEGIGTTVTVSIPVG